jgi:hypothetical protein
MNWYQDWTWWAVILMALTFAVLGYVLRPKRPRYNDPQLHDGPWELVGIVNHEAYWRRTQSAFIGGTAPQGRHDHIPHECHIGRGMSHLDRCACGAQRYGVYGPWEMAR